MGILTDLSTQGDLASRDFYCRSLYQSAIATQGGFSTGLEYYLIRSNLAPLELARLQVVSDSFGSEGEFRLYCKANTDSAADTAVAIYRPSEIEWRASAFKFKHSDTTLFDLHTTTGCRLFTTMYCSQGITFDQQNTLDVYQSGITWNVTLESLGTSLAFSLVRIGIIIVLRVHPFSLHMDDPGTLQTSQTLFASSRQIYTPPSSVSALFTCQDFVCVAVLSTTGILTIYRDANLTPFAPNTSVVSQGAVFTYIIA